MVKYKKIDHNLFGYAPFKGAVVAGYKWDNEYKSDSIEAYLELPTKVNNAKTIIRKVVKNKNEGIIFAGLEWGLQPLELFELIVEASKADLKIMIHTTMDLTEFQTVIGKSLADKVGYKEMLDKEIKTDEDKFIFSAIGTMILDYYIKDTYYMMANTLVEPMFYEFRKDDENGETDLLEG